jgi:hypothetical protein
LLANAATAWNMPENGILEIWAAPFLIAFIGAASALGGKGLYKWFTGEDGFAESLQVVFYGLALLFCMRVIVRLRRAAHHHVAVLYAVVAIGLVFMLGEELSWGQRIWGWNTPDAMRGINKQEETNLHNIYGVGSTFKWLQLVIGAYGTLLPILVQKLPAHSRQRRFLNWVVPHYTLIPYFAMLFAWRIYRNLFDAPRELYFVVAEYNEVLELVLAMGLFLFMVFQLRSLQAEELARERQERARNRDDVGPKQRLAA